MNDFLCELEKLLTKHNATIVRGIKKDRIVITSENRFSCKIVEFNCEISDNTIRNRHFVALEQEGKNKKE